MSELDLRGLACPQPVVETKKALERMSSGELSVLVTGTAARDNVRRLAESQKCTVRVEGRGADVYALTISKQASEMSTAEAPQRRVVVFINAAVLGRGDDELGQVLMKSFTFALAESMSKPASIVLMNGGVQLASEGSAVLDSLRRLADSGVDILVCGTCLDFFALKEKLRVGRVSNMYEIGETFLQADKVITA
jgi:selenium metabolism protein YedF